MGTSPLDPHALLEKHFGFREFLDAQEEVIQTILNGEDTLVVMPTGGGKSLCYQLPALMLDGVTVVVSPLIALMKDQVDALARRGISAGLINSSLPFAEQQARIRRLAAGDFKLVYIAPERFRSRAFMEALGEATISLFAVDEAHCISQWGHDFRPDYFRMGEVLDRLGRPQVAAFTATATPDVRRDILHQLGLREPREFVSGFSRPNLRLAVVRVDNEATKYARLKALLEEQKTGIVYCATRKRVEAVQATLAGWGAKTIAYHGGLSDAEREVAQNNFIERRIDVAVATNAFGMGIDRPDIRFVAHFEVPGSVEAYYQEAGRAGRDGEPSVCELFYNYADTRVQDFFIEGSNPSREVILDVYRALRSSADDSGTVAMSIRDLAERLDAASEMAVSAALGVLGRAGYLERFDIPGQRTRGTRITQPDVKPGAVEVDWAALAEKERRDRAKLTEMLRFVDARVCRQEAILRYFGEEDPQRCGNCDVCLDHSHAPRRKGTAAEVTMVRKALSGVARMSTRTADGWQGRYGRGRIVQALLGSRSREILDARLDQLSTHGLLHDEGTSYVNELFRELEQAGMLTLTRQTGFNGKDYQTVTLSPTGEAVMRGRIDCELAWPERGRSGGGAPARRAGRPEDARELMPLDPDLLAALRARRDDLAREQGNVPRYLIFSDATLEAFARLKPRTMDAGRLIRGVGEMKAERYLPAFIEVIRERTE